MLAGTEIANPVDLLAGASPDQIQAAIEAVLDDDSVDAVVAVVTPVLSADAEQIAAGVARAATGATKPVLACVLAVPEAPAVLRGDHVPWYSSPEAAVRALGRATRYAEWRRRDPGCAPALDGIDPDGAATALEPSMQKLNGAAAGEAVWLPASDAAALLGAYGIDVVPTVAAATVDDAVEAARRLGYPVVLKAGDPSLVHKSDLGGVQLDLHTDHDVRTAAAAIRQTIGDDTGFVVQPMAETGVEMIAGVVQDPAFGPLVMAGAGGTTAELLGDRTYRILPLTDRDAAEMIRSLRLAPLLFGYRGRPRVAVAELEDIVLRLARLADDLPQVAELDCNPIIVTPTAARVADIKVRVTPPPTASPNARRMLRRAAT
jgi:acyl-CoA synthetase (NDP forming)